MTTTIITKNSSTASAVPTSSDLVQGELAVNVTDKRLFTENASATIVELGTNPSSITTADITATGTVTANSNLSSSNAVLTGGTVNGIVIGGTTPSAITGTNITANTGFSGPLTGNVTGNLTGNVTGNITGDLTGNVTASSGTTTLNNLVLNGTVDFNTAVLTDLGAPIASTDAATKGYVDTQVSNLVGGAPAALDTLNELAAALNDDAAFNTTITNSIATKLPLAGGTMSGAIAMGSSKITGLADGTASGDAVNKGQLDTKLNLSGGTMTGNLVMGSNFVTSTTNPTDDTHLARKAYVDSILGSATAASTSAANAATSESNAATSATNAATSATNAATSETNAANSYDLFDDRFLGSKASDPTLDNDGDALVTGAIYFNTTSNVMKVYTGSAWQNVAPTATSITASQISDVTSTAAELNLNDGSSAGTIVNSKTVVYGSAGEVNATTLQLSGTAITSTAAELNILDGVTSSTAELNYLDITTLGTSEASKAVTADANGVVTFDNGKIEESTAITSASGAATINLRDGDNFTHTLSENVTYTFSNPAASGKVSAFTLKVTQDSTARTITWPSSVDWAAATAPTLTATSGGVDVFVFVTYDGGTTYYGFTAGQAMA